MFVVVDVERRSYLSDAFGRRSVSLLFLCGIDLVGAEHDLETVPHMLLAGQSGGFGVSVPDRPQDFFVIGQQR